MSKKFGKVGTAVGFGRTEGKIRKRVTRNHTLADVGQTFTDNYGKTYVYTIKGNIY